MRTGVIVGFVLLSGCRFGFDSSATDVIDAATPDTAFDGPTEVEECSSSPATPISPSVLTGSTAEASDDFFGSCGGGGSPDAVFALEVPAAAEGIRVAGDLPLTDFNSLIYVRDDCDLAGTELGCDARDGLGSDPQLRLRSLEPGTYFVFVDGEAGESGNYEVEVILFLRADASCEPGNAQQRCSPGLQCTDGTCQPAVCVAAQDLTGDAMVVGNTVAEQNVHTGTCGQGEDGGERAPEVIYSLSLANAVSDITLTTDNPGTDYDTLLYIRDGCNGTEIACNDDVGSGVGASLLTTGPLEAGEYFIFIDGFSYRSGNFELTVTVTP